MRGCLWAPNNGADKHSKHHDKELRQGLNVEPTNEKNVNINNVVAGY
jgi:hypothetical protein